MADHADSQPSRNRRRKASKGPDADRTNVSCDICKGRKTKCIDPVPGPCRYCARVSAPCTFRIKRKQRPFYLVSEEEYRYGIEVLQNLFPQLELNIDTLRNLAQSTKQLPNLSSVPVVQLQAANAASETCSTRDERPSDLPVRTAEVSGKSPLSTPVDFPEKRKNNPAHNEQKGGLVIDSFGVSRYVGPWSEIFFISAVRSCANGQVPQQDPRFTHLPRGIPPASPESQSSVVVEGHHRNYLPPRSDWGVHIDRYFSEIHSTYWLISLESFCSRLDSTYETEDFRDIPASWLCFLYAVLALTSQKHESSVCPGQNLDPFGSSLTANDYISLAKSLIKEVMDEANLDSVRALSAMSLFMHNQGFAVTSYLNIGTAVRIAYTLGFHQPQQRSEATTIHQETILRVAWTLYQLDSEICRAQGRPPNIEECSWHPTMSIEMTASAGTYDPWGLFNCTVSFNLANHRIYERIAELSKPVDQQVILEEMQCSITSLQAWYDALPPHLRLDATIPPPHMRPICLLHLRYWNSIIYITRLALLADVQNMPICGVDQQPPLSSLGQLCVDASESCHRALEAMHSTNVLSSLIMTDTRNILGVAMVTLLLLTRWQNPGLQQRLDRCTEILKSMDPIGFCRVAGSELSAIIRLYNSRFHGHSNQDMPVDLQGDMQPNTADIGVGFFLDQDIWTATGDWNIFTDAANVP